MNKRKLQLALAACWMVLVGMDVLAYDSVSIALDWTPNTNHTGIVVAQQLGYFAEEGLSVEIVQPGPTMSIQLAASGQCDFAVSMQEYVTMARAQNVPVVSIAAVFPHNTSGFAAPAVAHFPGPRLREPGRLQSLRQAEAPVRGTRISTSGVRCAPVWRLLRTEGFASVLAVRANRAKHPPGR